MTTPVAYLQLWTAVYLPLALTEELLVDCRESGNYQKRGSRKMSMQRPASLGVRGSQAIPIHPARRTARWPADRDGRRLGRMGLIFWLDGT